MTFTTPTILPVYPATYEWLSRRMLQMQPVDFEALVLMLGVVTDPGLKRTVIKLWLLGQREDTLPPHAAPVEEDLHP